MDETAERTIALTGNTTEITMKVFAEDFETSQEYTLTVSKAKAVKLNKEKLSLKAGKTAKLKVKNTSKKVTWKSSKPKIAKVNKNGKVTAVKAGKCKITATVGKKKLICNVTVKAAKAKKK